MRIRGIHYDIGTQTIEGSSSRPTLNAWQIDNEVADIRQGLHATAIRIAGGDMKRMASAAEVAARYGLEVWLSPMLPNADQGSTMGAIAEAARLAESLRRGGASSVLVLGCELSAFMSGILPGESHADRLALLSDPARLVAEVSAAGIDPQAEFATFIRTACAFARSAFQGPVTYASGTWENVDWSQFDFVGVDAYRDASNRQGYPAMLKTLADHGPPIVITEFGCAAYHGAAEAGGLAWRAVERTSRPPRLREGIERDEAEQATEVATVLALLETAEIEGAFIYTYIAPTYSSSQDPESDLDTASYSLVRSWPDGRTEQKAVYRAVADVYGGRRQS
jgi:hypothetical protein